MIKFFFDIIKNRAAFINAFRNSFFEKRMFYGVTFRNPRNMMIAPNANIEKGSRLLATDPTDKNSKNIIIGNQCWVGQNVEIQTHFGSRVEIKEFASVQDGCKILGSVSIGKYCILAPDIFMSSGNHYFKNKPYLTIREQDKDNGNTAAAFDAIDRPITIEEDCWIGKNVFIKQGVYVGRGAIIGTNSIVSTDIEPYSVNAGSPAEKIKDRLLFEPLLEISAFTEEHLPYFYSGFEHYRRDKNTSGLIADNKGIASEKYSLALLKQSNWKSITVTGYSKTNGDLKVYVDGLLCSNIPIYGSTQFQLQIASAADKNIFGAYEKLPSMIKRHLCIQFELISQADTKYDFAISKIKVL